MPKADIRRPRSPRRAALIRDLMEARHDLVALGQAHHMTPDELSAWVQDPLNAGTLSGMCLLADIQSQLLLSRYRTLAVSRLIKLATAEASAEDDPKLRSAAEETARKACVDLIRLDLKRATGAGDEGGGDDDADDPESAAMRSAMRDVETVRGRLANLSVSGTVREDER